MAEPQPDRIEQLEAEVAELRRDLTRVVTQLTAASAVFSAPPDHPSGRPGST